MSAHTAPINPATMTYSALLCAAAACEDSSHESDRAFAAECVAEIGRRLCEAPRPIRASDPRRQGFVKEKGRWVQKAEVEPA